MKIFSRLSLLLLFFSSTQITKAQNYGIGFDGTNDYVDCGNSAAFNANSIRTMECWVRFNGFSGTQEILSKSASSQGIELIVYSSSIRFYAMFNAGNNSYISYPTFNLTGANWYHIAATWDGTKESMRLYINGKSVGTRTDVGNINTTTLTNPIGGFKIGQWSDAPSRPLNGSIDEVRVWSVSRTASQVKNGMYGVVPAGSPGLIAYYRANEASGLTLTNATATPGLNGTLTNGPYRINSPTQGGSNSLHFDGSDDQVVIPANSLYDLTSGTIECFVKPGDLFGNACIISNRNVDGTRWSFHMSTSDNTIGLFNNTAYMALPYTFVQDQWYHLAFVCNNINTVVYVNGANIGTINQAFSTVTNQTVVIGMAKDNSDGDVYDVEPFLGEIDEVRIWNTVRTQTQIQNYKDRTLTGSETGLVGLFSFDQGINAEDNAGLSTLLDKTSNNNHGELYYFGMDGTSSNWLSHALITLPVKLSQFTATKSSDIVRLQWRTEQELNSREFIIERSTNGNSFSRIGSVNAAGNSDVSINYSFNDNNPQKGNNYYRLKEVDLDGRFEYSPVRSLNFATKSKLTWLATGSGSAELQLQQGNNEKYRLTDMNGQLVKHGHLINGKANMSNLVPGSYSVSVESAGGKVSALIVIR